MKRIIIEFSGGNMDGKRYDTEAPEVADREAAVTCYQRTKEGKDGAVEFARPSDGASKWQRYKVTGRRENDARIVVMMQYAFIA
jgi:hypothetical protein